MGRARGLLLLGLDVSMKSGLRDRNNRLHPGGGESTWKTVSMKSGLRDRNNSSAPVAFDPDQGSVSMKSGLRDRNNYQPRGAVGSSVRSLNEVRS